MVIISVFDKKKKKKNLYIYIMYSVYVSGQGEQRAWDRITALVIKTSAIHMILMYMYMSSCGG